MTTKTFTLGPIASTLVTAFVIGLGSLVLMAGLSLMMLLLCGAILLGVPYGLFWAYDAAARALKNRFSTPRSRCLCGTRLKDRCPNHGVSR